MAASALLLEFVVCFLVSLYLLHKYGDLRRQNVFSSIATFAAWYVSFLLVFTLPIDIASTYYNQCLHDSRPIIPSVDPNRTAFPANFSALSTAPTASAAAFSLLRRTIASESSRSIPNSDDLPPASDLITTHSSDDEANLVTLFSPVSSSFSSSSSSSSTSPPPTPSNGCVEHWTYSPEGTLQSIFRLVYWTSQLLTWIVLPLMQSYAWAGDFSITGKLRSAVIYNAIYYGSYLLIFGVLLIYVASRQNLTAGYLKVIGITASNTWGLFLLVLLLGYGLIEIPETKSPNSVIRDPLGAVLCLARVTKSGGAAHYAHAMSPPAQHIHVSNFSPCPSPEVAFALARQQNRISHEPASQPFLLVKLCSPSWAFSSLVA